MLNTLGLLRSRGAGLFRSGAATSAFRCHYCSSSFALRSPQRKRTSSLTTSKGHVGRTFTRVPAILQHSRYFVLTTVSSAAHPSSTPPTSTSNDPRSHRLISIIAHIDAGKTTLTERILHHCNALPQGSLPGDVDHGSTTTDFLEQERERGITIQSASVGPIWWDGIAARDAGEGGSKGKQAANGDPGKTGITLVDTPGHVDFTIEVERSVRVVDGAVVVLDGVAGVEAQTENVWRQAKRYDVRSLLLFVNKLDRPGSSFSRSILSVISKGLHPRPLALQLPIPAGDGLSGEPGIKGIVDLVTMEALEFRGSAGEEVVRKRLIHPEHQVEQKGSASQTISDAPILQPDDALLPASHPTFAEAFRARHALVESLSSLDPDPESPLIDFFLSSTFSHPHLEVPPDLIRTVIRRLTLEGAAVPVLCGSAYRNVGVQPLLDAIADYLPSPRDKSTALAKLGKKEGDAVVSLTDKDVVALAFKVVHDPRRGPMTFVRVYSGTLSRSTTLFNTLTQTRERLSKALLLYADRTVEVPALQAGQIGVLLGLRDTRTGDTLVSMVDPRRSVDGVGLRLQNVYIPPPVFSTSIEPQSRSDEKPVEDALRMLVRTDPSLRLDSDGQGELGLGTALAGGLGGGQTILSGMGELHLEIAHRRLIDEFGVRARMGRMRVSYRETVDPAGEASSDGEGVEVSDVFEKDLAGKKVKVGMTIRVRRLRDEEVKDADSSGNIIHIDVDEAEATTGDRRNKDEPSSADTAAAPGNLQFNLQAGLSAALSRGPLSSYPLTYLHVSCSFLQLFGPELSPPASLSAAASSILLKAVRKAGPVLMEPIMDVRVSCDDTWLGKVVGDLTSAQRGHIVEVLHDGVAAIESGEAVVGASDIYIPPEPSSSSSPATALEDLTSAQSAVRQKRTVIAHVPLSSLQNYSSRLRALTGGAGTFTMSLHGFGEASGERQVEILQELGRA